MTDESESVEFAGGVTAACHIDPRGGDPVGMFADRDDYLFYSYRHEEWKVIDALEELGYPVDRKPRTFRLFWGDEA